MGLIVGLVIGGILLLILGYTLYYFFTLYCFYTEEPRREFLFSYSKEDTDCGTTTCINLNKMLIPCCCPSLRETVRTVHLYPQNVSNHAFTTFKSLFAYKRNPEYTLQADVKNAALLRNSIPR